MKRVIPSAKCKFMKLSHIIVPMIVMCCWFGIAYAQQAIDSSAPWRDSRVQHCAERYLNEVVLYSENTRYGNKFIHIDEWGRLLGDEWGKVVSSYTKPKEAEERKLDNPTQYVWYVFNKDTARIRYGLTIGEFVRSRCLSGVPWQPKGVETLTGKTPPGEISAGPADLPGSSSATISANSGGTITTATGITLEIPPAALPIDANVTVIPVSVDDSSDLFVGGVRFEPDGTFLKESAVVRLPLPADWNEKDSAEIYEFKGRDPIMAMPSGRFVTIKGSQGSYVAEAEVYSFSGITLSRNCHAGTFKRIMENFQNRGCDRDSIIRELNSRYKGGFKFGEGDCRDTGPEKIQAFLNSYFDIYGAWDGPGDPVPEPKLEEILKYAREGRQVVLAFASKPWKKRKLMHDKYGKKYYDRGVHGEGYAHTTTLEVGHLHDRLRSQVLKTPPTIGDTEVRIVNTVKRQEYVFVTDPVTGQPKIKIDPKTGKPMPYDDPLRKLFGGEVAYSYPAAKLNEFRKLQLGVPLELMLTGKKDTLSDKKKNKWGLDLYNPLDGIKGTKIGPRQIPWPHVLIYVERPADRKHGWRRDQPPCVKIKSPPPEAIISCNPCDGKVPLKLALNATGSRGDGLTNSSYSWTLEDGPSSTGPTISWTYKKPRTYRVILTVKDKWGRQSTATKNIRAKSTEEIGIVIKELAIKPSKVNRGEEVFIHVVLDVNPGPIPSGIPAKGSITIKVQNETLKQESLDLENRIYPFEATYNVPSNAQAGKYKVTITAQMDLPELDEFAGIEKHRTATKPGSFIVKDPFIGKWKGTLHDVTTEEDRKEPPEPLEFKVERLGQQNIRVLVLKTGEKERVFTLEGNKTHYSFKEERLEKDSGHTVVEDEKITLTFEGDKVSGKVNWSEITYEVEEGKKKEYSRYWAVLNIQAERVDYPEVKP